MAPDPSDPFVFASIQFLIHKQQQRKTSRYSRFGSSSSSRLFPSTISANGTVRHSKRKNRICSCADPPRIYLKPGALAQLRDAHKNCRLTPLAIFSPKKKKKISCSINEPNSFETTDVEISQVRLPRGDEDRNDAQFMAIPSFTPGPSIRMFGPLCPQRKKLLAPKNPLHHPTVINAAASVPIMLDNLLPVSPDPERVSLLESLPLELLVRIVCNLHHDQLKPTFRVSRRLRQAVLVARQCHFDFITPDRDRQDAVQLLTPRGDLSWPFKKSNAAGGEPSRPPTPKAPRHATKTLQPRISLADMQQLAVPLFPGSTASRVRRLKPSNYSRPSIRGLASHRVLFYEEDLCQAVAQSSL